MSKFINRFLTVVTIAAMVLSAIFMIALFGSVIGLTAQASNIMSADATGVSAPTGMGADITILLVFLGVVFFIEEGVLLGSIFLRKAIFKKIQAKKAAKKLQESKQVA